jgi:hypothetical protein
MARVRISELPQLTSGSINTILVGDDNGVTYQIPLNTLTQSVVNMLSSSIDGRLDILEANASTYLTSLDGAITSSQQIEDLGFITSSGIDTSIFATTGSNIFNGNQTISGSVGINANSGSWNFAQNGTLTLPNGSNIYGNNLLQIDAIGGFQLNSYTNEFGSGSQVWAFNSDGTLNVPGNIYGADNLLTTESFNAFSESYNSDSTSFDSRIETLENYNDDDSGYVLTADFNSLTQSVAQQSLRIASLSSSVSYRLNTLETAVDVDNYVTTSSYNTDSSSFDSRIIAATNEQFLGGFTTTSSFNSFTESIDNRVSGLEAATSSYLTSLEGTNVWSSSTQLPTDIISSSTQISELGFISTSTDLSGLNTISASYLDFTQSYYSDSSSFDGRLYTLETAVDVDNYATTSSFNEYTQSTNNSIAGLTTTSSFNSFTHSQNELNETWATTGSNTFKGDQYVSGTIWMSGSIIPIADASLTSSFSLGSSTNAWKDIWVSQGTIHFIGSDGAVKDTLSATADGLSMTNLQVTGSIIATSITGSLLSTNNVISSSQQIAGLGFATTGSNTFKQSQTISGSLTITQNLILLGSASVQYITSSQLNIADNIITVNTIQPSIRFGGLAVIDSGSNPQRSGSMLFDSQENQWIYVHQNNSTITSSLLIMGPETYNGVGSEIHPTTNRVMKSTNDEHIGDSNISDNGTKVSIDVSTDITGSLKVTSAISASTFTGLGNLTAFSTSIDNQLTALEIYSASLKNEFTISASQLFINTSKVNISGSTLSLNSINNNNIYFLAANVSTSTSGGGDGEGGNTTTTKVTGSLVWDVINQYWKAGIYGSEVELADVNYVDTAINDLSSSVRTTIQTLSSSFASKALINSQSAWGAFQSASVISASGFLADLTQSNQIASLTAKTGSYLTTSSFNTFTSSFNTISASFSTRIDAVDDRLVSTSSFNTFTSSYLTDSSSFASKSLINSQSAFGAFTSASSYSSSVSSSLSLVSASLNTRFNTFSSSINSLIIVQSASLFVTTASFNTFSSSYKTDSASFSSRIDAVNDNLVSTASFNTFTASYTTTSASFASKSLINSQSAWGAFTSASSYSASLAIAIQAVNDNLATTSSNTFIGNEIITGSLVVTGSIASNVVAVTISSSTASLDLSKGNNFTLTLSGSNTRIVATNIKPGITANLLITTGTNTSASFSSIFLQPSGSAYSASFGSGKKDIISLSSFDATTLYVTSVKNFVTQSVGGGG